MLYSSGSNAELIGFSVFCKTFPKKKEHKNKIILQQEHD